MSKHRRTGRKSRHGRSPKGAVLLLSADKLRSLLSKNKRAHTLRIQTEGDSYGEATILTAAESGKNFADTPRSHVLRLQVEE